jgi:hypothetical protein
MTLVVSYSRRRVGFAVELIKVLPDGIGVIPLFNVRHGKIEEFQATAPADVENIGETMTN